MPSLRIINGLPEYQPAGKVLAQYLTARNRVDVIRGPIGSGTSTASCFRIYMTAMQQEQSPRDGRRHTRWAVVRRTYPELNTSTLRTWLHWFPEELYGRLNRARPMHQVIQIADLDCEVWFLALDGIEDVQKLRSVEYTGVWFNELEYADYDIFTEAKSRTSRYPAIMDGGPTWYGVIGDMNAPNEEHWTARMTGEAPYPDEVPLKDRLPWPKEWGYFKQPPALIEKFAPDNKTVVGYVENPEAENAKWQVPGYWLDLTKGARKSWIDSRLMNRMVYSIDGDPVWPQYSADWHFSKEPLPYIPGLEVVVALDFGRRPCALMSQEVGDRIQVQREHRLYGVGAATFAPSLKKYLEHHYRGAKVRFTGDPKGRDRGQADERTAYEVFASYGMNVTPAPVRNNNLDDRIESVAYALTGRRLLVSRDCTTLVPALAGKYHFKKLDIGDPEPVKDKYSDAADCLQYLCLFLGEGRRMYGLDAAVAAKAIRVHLRDRSLRRVSA